MNLFEENKFLCLLENLLNARDILKKQRIRKDKVILFHEWTRKQRVTKIVRTVLKGFDLTCIPIDFDVTANRFLSKDSLRKREAKMLELDMWVLKNPKDRMRKLHRLYHRKIVFLRKAGGENHVNALREWWEKELWHLTLPRK